MEMTVFEFQSKCVELMDDIQGTHEEVIITKDHKPVAKLLPITTGEEGSLFGFMKGTVKINGDIMSPIDEKWNVEV